MFINFVSLQGATIGSLFFLNMLARFAYYYLLLFIAFTLKGQINLVPNPSFESMNKPCDYVMAITPFNNYLTDWYVINTGTIEYLNSCSNALNYPTASSTPLYCKGYQLPRTGNAFIGMSLYSKELNLNDSVNIFTEYLSVKLKDTLRTAYCFYSELYANLSNISLNSINQISMLFTQNTFTTSIGSFTNSIQPQVQWDTTQFFTDTLNWVKISGMFIAQGGEQYLTIGNFRDGGHLKRKGMNSNFIGMLNGSCGNVAPLDIAYFNIDDVALYELPSPQIQNTAITICPHSDSLVLGDTARVHSRYQWYANGVAIDTTSFIKVKPNQTTTYVLQTTQCAVTTQSIVVTYSNNCEPVQVVEPVIPNVFTPNADSINDVWRFNLGKGNTLNDIAIFNRWGNVIYQKENTLAQNMVWWDGRTNSGEETSSGVYYFVLRYTDVNGEEHRKNGYVTLMR